MVEIPRRSVNIDVDGKVFVAKELSVAYLKRSMENEEMDTAELALMDSIGEITEEDWKHFGIDTKNLIYAEIVKFTFQDALTAEDLELITKELNISLNEIKAMDRSAQIQLKNIVGSREKRDKAKEKKI